MTGRGLLKLGAFVCADGDGDVDTGRGYTVFTEGQDFTLGNPQPVEVTVGTLLKDGTVKAHSRYENRDDTYFAVTITGDSIGLAQGEADLLAEMDRRNELTVRTYDGKSTVVLDVLAASLVPMPDDFAEAHYNQATYGVRLSCLPWVREPVPEVLTSTVAVSPARTSLNACDSTTGWTFHDTGAVVALDGRTCLKVSAAGSVASGSSYATGTVVASRTVTATDHFVSIDVKFESTDDSVSLQSQARGSLRMVQSEAMPSGWTRYYFDANGVPANDVLFVVVSFSRALPSSTGNAWIDDLSTQATLPVTSVKETLRSLPTRGSRSAPCSVKIEAASGQFLGQTMVLSTPDLENGFMPNLRQFRISGPSVTDDATRISGHRESLVAIGGGPFTAAVSTAMLREGAYEVIAFADATALSAQIGYNGVNSPPYVSLDSGTLPGGWGYYSLGIVHLPHIPVPPESRKDLLIRIAGSGTLDEVFLIPRDDDSALTIVAAARALWLDSPSLDQPRGGLWGGTLTDKSDAMSLWANAKAKGSHYAAPGKTLLFVATEAPTTLPTVTLTHYPAGHTRVPSKVTG